MQTYIRDRRISAGLLIALIAALALHCGDERPRVKPFTIRLDSLKVMASWSPNTEPDLVGYWIHYGKGSRSYDHKIEVLAPDTSVVITGLDPGSTYFFAATAVDTAGNESLYSEEVSASTPPDTGVTVDTTITAESELFVVSDGVSKFADPMAGGEIVVAFWGIDSVKVFAALNLAVFGTVSLELQARGDSALGVWPKVEIALGDTGNVVAGAFVESGIYTAVRFDSLWPSGTAINILFANDDYKDNLYDRNLYVRSLTVRHRAQAVSEFDLNGSGTVDALDWIFLLRHIGINNQGAQYRPGLDFNADGWIDGMDKAFFARQSKFI